MMAEIWNCCLELYGPVHLSTHLPGPPIVGIERLNTHFVRKFSAYRQTLNNIYPQLKLADLVGGVVHYIHPLASSKKKGERDNGSAKNAQSVS